MRCSASLYILVTLSSMSVFHKMLRHDFQKPHIKLVTKQGLLLTLFTIKTNRYYELLSHCPAMKNAKFVSNNR